MAPLFDLEPLVTSRPPAGSAEGRDRTAADRRNISTIVPTPVNYWVRGVFRCGDGHFTRTVQAIGMSTRLDADVARFIAYLTTDGFGFAEGRGYLSELLGVGADDGVHISVSHRTDEGSVRRTDEQETEARW